MKDHIPKVIETLVERERNAVQEALENIVPPWCEGIQEDFWITEAGQRLAESLWFINMDEVMAVTAGKKIIRDCFSKDPNDLTFKKNVAIKYIWLSKIKRYPFPNRMRKKTTKREYVLRSDVMALKEQIEEGYVLKHAIYQWLEMNIKQLDKSNDVLYARFQKQTQLPINLRSFSAHKHAFLVRHKRLNPT